MKIRGMKLAGIGMGSLSISLLLLAYVAYKQGVLGLNGFKSAGMVILFSTVGYLLLRVCTYSVYRLFFEEYEDGNNNIENILFYRWGKFWNTVILPYLIPVIMIYVCVEIVFGLIGVSLGNLEITYLTKKYLGWFPK